MPERIRKQVYIAPRQQRLLKALAKKLHVTEAELFVMGRVVAGGCCNDQETEVRGMPALVPEEQPEDWETTESRHVQDTQGCGEARTGGPALQASLGK